MRDGQPRAQDSAPRQGDGGSGPPRWWRIAARVRGTALTVGFLAIIASILGRAFELASDDAALNILVLGWLLLALGLGLSSVLGTPRIAPRPVAPPVRGRWRANNSPATRVPSHRTHLHGQTFAIDLVHAPDGGARFVDKQRAFRPPEDFPSFGQQIVAPAAGRVVLVRDGARDHRSRSTPNAISFMRLEGQLRQAVGGARLLAGNLIVLDLGGGVYAALAHLKQRSATVKPGQQVSEGQVLARCGNSGHSTEPHLHFQLMDHPRQLIAAGLPFTFGISDERSPDGGRVPRNGEEIRAASSNPSPV